MPLEHCRGGFSPLSAACSCGAAASSRPSPNSTYPQVALEILYLFPILAHVAGDEDMPQRLLKLHINMFMMDQLHETVQNYSKKR